MTEQKKTDKNKLDKLEKLLPATAEEFISMPINNRNKVMYDIIKFHYVHGIVDETGKLYYPKSRGDFISIMKSPEYAYDFSDTILTRLIKEENWDLQRQIENERRLEQAKEMMYTADIQRFENFSKRIHEAQMRQLANLEKTLTDIEALPESTEKEKRLSTVQGMYKKIAEVEAILITKNRQNQQVIRINNLNQNFGQVNNNKPIGNYDTPYELPEDNIIDIQETPIETEEY